MTTNQLDVKPNGPAAAAFLATGIGAFVLGLAVTLNEAFPPALGETAFWDFSKTYGIGSGNGPLSGKVITGTLAYLIGFIGFGLAWRGRDINLRTALTASVILLALGFALTFRPISRPSPPNDLGPRRGLGIGSGADSGCIGPGDERCSWRSRRGQGRRTGVSLDFAGVNWLAVIVAAAAGIVIGFVWYAPPVFGRRWARATGIELPQPGQVQPMTYVGAIVTVLVTAYVLAVLSEGLGAATLADGAIVGVVVWLGFVATWLASGVLFERRSTEWWVLNAGQAVVSLAVMGAIIGYMG
jgi:hypothetical protein